MDDAETVAGVGGVANTTEQSSPTFFKLTLHYRYTLNKWKFWIISHRRYIHAGLVEETFGFIGAAPDSEAEKAARLHDTHCLQAQHARVLIVSTNTSVKSTTGVQSRYLILVFWTTTLEHNHNHNQE